MREQDIVREIRRNNGVDDDFSADPAVCATVQNLKRNLGQSLQVLCDELYSRPAHFVLELLQNAEDNAYADGVQPELRIILRETYMDVECNELGFSDDNVKAFCGIGQSTKKNQQGYIGEKGIGAKSIFQVANKVLIHSRGYAFSLDRTEELGMISPRWAPDFTGVPGWTRMQLVFCDQQQFHIVKKQLEHVRATVLLFMRKLTRLNIDDGLGPPFVASRTVKGDVVTINMPTLSYSFVLVSQVIPAYRHEAKRTHSETTEIVLSFPLDQKGEPWSGYQYVYAFLPLKPAGFKFMIQADFLTAANREDILWDLPWNQHIAAHIAHAFLCAVPRFKQSPKLELTWPRYLPSAAHMQDPFFGPITHNILSALRASPVVMCTDGAYHHPGAARFATGFGGLIPAAYTSFFYASPAYPEDVRPQLAELGVGEMDFADFIDGLLAMGILVAEQSNEWLEAVCALLCQWGTTWNAKDAQWDTPDPRIRNLSLAHLRSNSWAKIHTGRSFFFDDQDMPFPKGLGISILQPHTASPQRKQLLERLGVRPVDAGAVVDKILALHRGAAMKFSAEEMLEHALYVFERRHGLAQEIKPSSLWLPDTSGQQSRGNALYINDPKSLAPLADILKPPARFIHDSFVAPEFALKGTSSSATAWREWLQSALGVSPWLRIVAGRPAPEFVDLINDLRLVDPARLLLILREHWPGIHAQPGSVAFCKYLATVQVRCLRGVVAELCATTLAADDLPRLPVAEAEDGWAFLAYFGVSVERDANFYLKALVAVAESGDENPQGVKALYKQLEARFNEIPDKIRAAFEQHRLIFAHNTWLSLSQVVWDGPHITTLRTRLKPVYPGMDELFHRHLGVYDASPADVADELRQFAIDHRSLPVTTKSRERLMQLLDFAAGTVELIRKGACKDWTAELHSLAFLPVRRPGCSVIMLSSCAGQFYLPDPSGHLEGVFAQLVPFLDVGPAQAIALRPLFVHLDIESKRIDRCVTEQVLVDSAPLKADDAFLRRKLHREETVFYRFRLSFFQRLQYYKLLSNTPLIRAIRVLKVHKLDVTYTVSVPRPVTLSRPLECWARMSDGELQLFVLSSLSVPRRRGTSVAEALAKCLGLSDADIPVTAAILRYDPDEADVLLRKSGVRELDDSVDVGLPPAMPECDEEELREEIMDSFLPPQRAQPFGGMVLSDWGHGRQQHGVSSDRSGSDRPFLAPLNVPLPVSPSRPTLRRNKSSTNTPEDIDVKTFVQSDEGRKEIVHLQRFATQTSIPAIEPTTPNLGAVAQRVYETPPASPTISKSNPSSPSKRPTVPTADLDVSPIGYLGEKFVFDLLKDHLPKFSYENWTSSLRILAGFPAFIGESLADFSYVDTDGALTEKLYPGSGHLLSASPVEYLIEVKATSGEQNDVFYMSRNQFHQALHLSRWGAEGGRSRQVYMLFRVSGIGRGGTPVVKAYADPHALLAHGLMRIESDKVEVRIV